MASPYKMKNPALKMAAKGAPMQKNYAGSPMHDNDDKDPNPPVYNQQDSSWAIGMRRQELSNQNKTYRPSKSEVRLGSKKNAKEILKNTEAKIKKSGNYGNLRSDTYNTLKKSYKTNQKNKKRKIALSKAVKGTKENTTGVIRGDRD